MEFRLSTPDKRVTTIGHVSASEMKTHLARCFLRISILAAGAITLLSLPPTVNAQGPLSPATSIPGSESSSFQRRESALERFRSYSGKRSKANLIRLFQQYDPFFQQEPPVLLSDGTSKARVTLRFFGRGDQLPVFSVSGGHCVSARPADSGAWILEIVPNSGSLSTSVTILSGGSMIEYPLTVAPPMRLFDKKRANAVTIEYVSIANELAASRMAPAHK